jgi:sarcosine oxidase subunit beta
MFGKGKRFWTPAPLPAERGIVIIGGGVRGLSTAFFLATVHKRRDVAVLEAGRIGRGPSAWNPGVVRADQRRPELAAFSNEGLELWPWLIPKLNLPPVFRRRGVLTLAHDPAAIAEMRTRAITGGRLGVESLLLDPLSCRELAPALDVTDRPRHPVVGGLFHPPGGTVRPAAVLWGLARAAARRGVTFHEGVRATRIEVVNGRVAAVETDRGVIRTGRVVVAAGAGAGALARSAGLSPPLRPFRRAAMATRPLKPFLDVALTVLADRSQIIQGAGGELMAAGPPRPLPPEAADDPPAPPEGFPERRARALTELMPCLAGVGFQQVWAGRVDRTPDRMPIVDGDAGVEGLFLDCGGGETGFQTGPVTGKHLAAYIVQGRRPDRLAPFALSRFGPSAGPPAGTGAADSGRDG